MFWCRWGICLNCLSLLIFFRGGGVGGVSWEYKTKQKNTWKDEKGTSSPAVSKATLEKRWNDGVEHIILGFLTPPLPRPPPTPTQLPPAPPTPLFSVVFFLFFAKHSKHAWSSTWCFFTKHSKHAWSSTWCFFTKHSKHAWSSTWCFFTKHSKHAWSSTWCFFAKHSKHTWSSTWCFFAKHSKHAWSSTWCFFTKHSKHTCSSTWCLTAVYKWTLRFAKCLQSWASHQREVDSSVTLFSCLVPLLCQAQQARASVYNVPNQACLHNIRLCCLK